MCKLVNVKINGRDVKVADIKQDCIRNIYDAARKCDYIDKIMLFGSAITERCREESDVDIAVFGNVSQSRCYASKKYDDFTHQLYSFNDYDQTYDILYFKTGAKNNSRIMSDIEKGELIYER